VIDRHLGALPVVSQQLSRKRCLAMCSSR